MPLPFCPRPMLALLPSVVMQSEESWTSGHPTEHHIYSIILVWPDGQEVPSTLEALVRHMCSRG